MLAVYEQERRKEIELIGNSVLDVDHRFYTGNEKLYKLRIYTYLFFIYFKQFSTISAFVEMPKNWNLKSGIKLNWNLLYFRGYLFYIRK